MLKNILNRLGYISKADAELLATTRAKETIAQIEAIKPGDELINASRTIRRYGFKIVYALGDGNAEKNCVQLAESILIDKSRMVQQFLPNVKVVDDKTLLT